MAEEKKDEKKRYTLSCDGKLTAYAVDEVSVTIKLVIPKRYYDRAAGLGDFVGKDLDIDIAEPKCLFDAANPESPKIGQEDQKPGAPQDPGKPGKPEKKKKGLIERKKKKTPGQT